MRYLIAFMDRDRDLVLIDARLFRRCAKVLTSYDGCTEIINELSRIADRLQNQACGFEEQAVAYDTPPIEREQRKEEPPPLED
jgi:hypothetical protein